MRKPSAQLHGRLVLALALGFLSWACQCTGLGLSEKTKFRCLPDGGCAAGYRCDGRYCVVLAEEPPPCEDGGPCTSPFFESECKNGVDDDWDGLLDCLDADCNGTPCDDGDLCTTGEVCASRLCAQGQPVQCLNPTGLCRSAVGSCVADGGCEYPFVSSGTPCGVDQVCGRLGGCMAKENNAFVCSNGVDDDDDGRTDCDDPKCAGVLCDDQNACTSGEFCSFGDGGACTGGTLTVCTSPPTTCFSDAGTCNTETGACSYAQFSVGSACSPPIANRACGRDAGCMVKEAFAAIFCRDSVDNDDNGLTDCADPQCGGFLCDDSNPCTTGERCDSGVCSGGSPVTCNPCLGSGICNPDGGCPSTPVNLWAACPTGVCGTTGACNSCTSNWCVADAPGGTGSLWGVLGLSATDIWAVGDNSILRWNGVTWTKATLSGGGQNYRGVWPVSITDAWAVGALGSTSRWNGTSWTAPFTNGDGGQLNALWGVNATLIWAGGDIDIMRRWNGTAWRDDWPSTGDWWQRANGVWGSSATNIWSVGPGMRINHYDGGWSQFNHGLGSLPEGWDVHGTTATNVWVVGGDSVVIKFNGASWSVVRNGTPGDPILRAVWVVSATNVWAAGDRGLVLHNTTGTLGGWTTVDVGTTNDLQDIWAANASDIWIVGYNSTLLRYRP